MISTFVLIISLGYEGFGFTKPSAKCSRRQRNSVILSLVLKRGIAFKRNTHIFFRSYWPCVISTLFCLKVLTAEVLV